MEHVRRYDTGVVSPFMPDSEKVAAIRQLLPATGAGIYLNAGTCGPLPAETMRAMDEQAARELAVGRAKLDQFVAFMDRMAEPRASIAALLVADPDDIALTHSTTDGINLVGRRCPGRPATASSPPTTSTRASSARSSRCGTGSASRWSSSTSATVATTSSRSRRPARPRAPGPGRGREPRAVDDRRRAAGRGLGTLAREAGAVSMIDGAQSAGAIPVALDELDVDAYAVPGQKWLLGPEGMGALWVRRAFADATIPAMRRVPLVRVLRPRPGRHASRRTPAGSRRRASTGRR